MVFAMYRMIMRPFLYFFMVGVFFIAMIAGSSYASSRNLDAKGNPRSDVIPADNSDLDDIMAKAAAIKAFGEKCQELECPELDCEHARILRDNLADAISYTEFLIKWLQKANDAHMAHFNSLVELGRITGENMARAQEALGWQKFFHDMGSNLLDIASIADFMKGFLGSPEMARGADQWRKMDDDLTFNKFMSQIDSFYEALKDFESGLDNMSGHLEASGGTGTPLGDMTPEGLFGLSRSDINNDKSTLSDLYNTLDEAVRNGKDWRKTLRNGGAAAIGQIAGRYLKAYDEKLMKERQQRIDALFNDLSASDRAQSASYLNLQKVQNRRFKAEDALDALREADYALVDCMAKAKCPLESQARKGFDVTARLHNFIQTGPNGEEVESWGWALEVFNNLLDEVRSRLDPPFPNLEDDCRKTPAVGTTGDSFTGEHVLIASDSPTWCTYTDGNPTSVPLDGDNPRDTSPPGGGVPPGDEGNGPRDTSTPTGDGDSPRDVSPPHGGGDKPGEVRTPGGDGNGPRDVPSDPCQELKDLRSRATRLWREIQNPGTTAARRAQARKQLDEVSKRIRELQDKCPEPGGQGPRDTGKPQTEKPSSVPTVTIYIKAKTSVLKGEQGTSQATAELQVKLVVSAVSDPQLPGDGVDKPQTDHAQAPIQGTTDAKGNLTLKVPVTSLGTKPSTRQPLSGIGGPAFQVTIDSAPQGSSNVKISDGSPQEAVSHVPDSAKGFLTDVNVINGLVFLTFTYPLAMQESMNRVLIQIPGVVNIQINFCRDKQDSINDPYYTGTGAWGQAYENQWAIKRVGLTAEQYAVWNKLGAKFSPVIVAVIDTGLDWNHLDFDWKNLWQNPKEIAGNGIDDDGNGYVDDMIGWDFMGKNNKPWDYDGHGTHVAGVIAATQNNGIGMAGINPHARLMVLKALNNFGHTRASYLAKAIVYAVDNGARVINMSVGGKHLSDIEQEAVKYAVSKGVLIVAASGNEGINVGEFGPAGIEGILTVASTDLEDKRAGFSNWGPQIDLAAPGIDVMGLRARRTDTMRDIPGVEYVNGANFVGDDNRYYRASGTSFSAPIVTGVASLILSGHPELSGSQVARMLKQSATDIDVPGVDQYSGYGIVNAAVAMSVSPEFFIHSLISGVQVARTGDGLALQVLGTADADRFRKATVSIGAGDNPSNWTDVLKIRQNVRQGLLGNIPAARFQGAKAWTIRLITEHQSGAKREIRFRLNLG